MTQSNYRDETLMNKHSTIMEQMFGRLNTGLEKLGMITDGYENIGHRLSNTDRPKADDTISSAKMSSLVQADGLLSELDMKLNRMESFINRLEETGKKLSELI